MIGSYLYTFSDTNRLDELVPQTNKRKNINLDIEEIVAYVSAGMHASK